MTVVGIAMVRDEEDIIEPVIRHMLTQVDAIIVGNNMSVDETDSILGGIQCQHSNLVVYLDDVVGYEQSKKMTALARLAREEFGADWIVPFDADEIWYSPQGRIADFLESGRAARVVFANLYDHVCTGADSDDPNPVKRLQWRRDYANPLPKVACRWSQDMVIGMGNHEVFYDDDPLVSGDRLAIRHFPYRSAEQIIRKVRNGAEAYAATDLPEHYGAHWRQWGRILDQDGPGAIEALFHKWYYREHPDQVLIIEREMQKPLRFDPACELTSTC